MGGIYRRREDPSLDTAWKVPNRAPRDMSTFIGWRVIDCLLPVGQSGPGRWNDRFGFEGWRLRRKMAKVGFV